MVAIFFGVLVVCNRMDKLWIQEYQMISSRVLYGLFNHILSSLDQLLIYKQFLAYMCIGVPLVAPWTNCVS